MFIKMQLLLFLIGSVSFHAFAEEASTVLPDDEAPTTDSRDSDISELSTFPVTTDDPVTTDSVLSTSGDGENSTEPSLPEPSDDGLETAALVGIIFGVIAAIAVATAIIIVIVKKMGRYSP